jgi:acyl-CoA thioester hydrolase
VLDDKLFIDVENIKLKKISGTFHQSVYKEDGTVCADAEVTWACVTKAGIPHPIPNEFMVPGLLPEDAAS